MPEIILPGTYITIRDEGLISAGRVAVGNIGIVGTAQTGDVNKVAIVGSLAEARAIFANPPAPKPDDKPDKTAYSLMPALQYIYGNGGSNVYAVRARSASAEAYAAALEALANETINLVVLAGPDAGDDDMRQALKDHLKATAENKHERIGVIGAGATTTPDAVKTQVDSVTEDTGRLILVTPGVQGVTDDQGLSAGSALAAAVTGLLASLPVQASPTNKVLNLKGLTFDYPSSQLEKLIQNRALAVEKREGFRIVKGITTSTNTAWTQITTRRIVDYALYGIRSAANPYIGKLNNSRVRSAMKATFDAFLTRMVQDEALTSYDLSVSATREQEVRGEVQVLMTLKPTFSIDFVMVTMYLG